jgi:subtilase family serine protease
MPVLSAKRIGVGFAVSLTVGVLLIHPWGARSAAVDKPDLVATGVTDPPASALPGDSFSVTATIKNQGVAAAGGSTTKFFLVGAVRKNLKGVQTILPLDSGASDGPSVTIAVYSDTAPGTYGLQACADGLDEVDEAVETNNCTDAVSAITVLQAPDLVVPSVADPPATAAQGQAFTANNTVQNVGPVQSAASITKYYLVATADGTRKDLKGPQSATVPALDPGQIYNEQETLTVRPETAPGVYALQACADGGKFIAEEDDNNNCSSSTGTIQVTPRPDLVVTSTTVQGAPLTVAPTATLSVSATVKNQGLLDANSSSLKYSLVNTVSGATKNLNGGTQSVPSLVSGASVTVQKTVTVYSDTASGTYALQACADNGKVIAESSESNNCQTASGTVTVQGAAQADLVATSVSNPPSTAVPGDSISLTATIQNLGPDAANASTTSFYLLGATKKNLKGGQSVGPLGPGASETPAPTSVIVYSDTIPGSYVVQACADGPKSLAEPDETNNCVNSAGSITILQTPDLTVTAIANLPASAEQGASFQVQNTVKNIGPVAANQPTRTKYYLVATSDGSKTDLKGPTSPSVPVLNPTEVFVEHESVVVRPETEIGQYRLQACVDSDKVLAESDENNNCRTSVDSIQVVARPDLVVPSVTVQGAPLNVARKGTLTISADVKNQGLADATLSSTIKFSLVNTSSGATKNLSGGTQTVSSLVSGASTSVQKTVIVYSDTVLGTYKVRACADSTKVILESSESNNCTLTNETVTVQ